MHIEEIIFTVEKLSADHFCRLSGCSANVDGEMEKLNFLHYLESFKNFPQRFVDWFEAWLVYAEEVGVKASPGVNKFRGYENGKLVS
ncbi:MAG: hypothetical protein M1300_07335 [Epsilonproteobacteria bacterium]|nr:hypothetical protein [Campylobacterota bacterium]